MADEFLPHLLPASPREDRGRVAAPGPRADGELRRRGEPHDEPPPSLMSFVGADCRYRFVNGGYERWFDMPASDIVGRHLRDVLGERAWGEIRHHVERALAGETVSFDTLVSYRRGGPRWVRATYTPDIDAAGLVRGFGAVVVDINGQKRAEQQLRESEHRLRLTMEASQTGVWEWNPEAGEVRWSPECYAIHGLAPGEFAGTADAFARLVHPEDSERVWAAVRAAFASDALYECEFRVVRPDGSIRWVANRGRALADPATGGRRMVGTIADITSHRQVLEALRASEARFRAIAEATPDIIFTATPEGACDYVNDRIAEFTGLSADAALGGGWAEAVHPDDLDEISRRWLDAIRSGAFYNAEFRMRRAGGGYRWIAARACPVREAGGDGRPGRVLKWVGCCTDVHAAKAAQEILAGVNERLTSAIELKTAELERSYTTLQLSERMATLGTFAAGLGHDLANLLLPVRGRIGELLAVSSLPESARADIVAIQRSMEHIQGLCRALRLFAMDPDAELAGSTRLQDWCPDIEPVLRTSLPRSIQLRCFIPADLPEVGIAPHRLSQAVLNSVQNARDAIAAAGQGAVPGACPTGDIEVGAEAVRSGPASRPGFVRLWVRDNGPGMPESVRARCLEPFFTTKAQSQGGTGLGLSIVHGIVTKAGGRVEIQSAPGQGATFSLFLPVSASSADCAVPTRSAPGEKVRNGHGPRSALITLRDARAAAYAASILSSRGLSVQTASSVGALEPKEPPALWVTDATPRAMRAARAACAGPAPPAIIALGGDDHWRQLGAATLPLGVPLPSLRESLERAAARRAAGA